MSPALPNSQESACSSKGGVKIINLTQGTTLADNVCVADNIFTRIKGLLGKEGLTRGEALIIKPCNSIHMFFMRFAIDAVFADKNNKVVGLVERLRPFRLSPIFFKAYFVIELPAGTIQETRTKIQDRLSIE
jgi:Uncharacterized conserved protein